MNGNQINDLDALFAGDISPASERLRASDERYRALFELGPVAVYSCDRYGSLQEFNHRAVELWGREPAVGDADRGFFGPLKLIRPDGTFMPQDQAFMTDVLSGTVPERLDAEAVIERPDGSRITIVVNIRPLKNERGEITGAINCFYDITERKQAEQRLRVSEMRYRRLFEAANDGILILDAETEKIIEANRFMLKLLQQPLDHFIGKKLCDLGMPSDRDEWQRAIAKLQTSGSMEYDNLPLQDRNGLPVSVEVVSNVYVEIDASVIQCNIRDISERKRFEGERLRHLESEQLSRGEAEIANRAKDLFLATLSHEMRAPLNAIVGWVSILRNGGCSDSEWDEGLDVIERNTQAQVKLMEDVLDVSRIVSGKLRLEIRPCSLIEVIGESLDSVRASAEARGIVITEQLDATASHSSCDPGRIQQVVWNLLSNAIKFTPKGGTIGIALTHEQSSLGVQVTDSGLGIGPELLPYVFDRFRQGDSTTRRKYSGLGLGLSIVKHIVEMHGGTVEARSAGEGKGSTFSFVLPVQAVELDESMPPPIVVEAEREIVSLVTSTPKLVRLDGIRLLVVDDEADARRLLAKVLQRAGAIVVSAGSVAEALELLPHARADVLVSDIGMPDQDGFDLIRQIRELGYRAKDLPAVALTGFVTKGDQRQALLAGFQVHVSKPVDPHDLTMFIAALAGRTGEVAG